jgi:uncharacterized protein
VGSNPTGLTEKKQAVIGLFFCEFFCELSIDLKTTMMYYHSMSSVKLEEIKIKVLPILKQANIKKAALFGSYVSGTSTKESDIDILVELPDNATLFELGGLKVSLEEKLHKKVDVVTYKNISPIIRSSILSNQYPLL